MQQLIAMFFLSLMILPAHQKWQEFKTFEGRFKVMVPGEMQMNERTIHTDIGEIRYMTYYFQDTHREAENLMYMVTYCDYPMHSIHSDSTTLIDEFFEQTIEAAAISVSGELRYAEPLNYKEYPGRYWRIDYQRGHATLKTRAFLVENRFYTVQTATRRGSSLNNATEKFLDSFTLLEE